jgi:hypothetical protein
MYGPINDKTINTIIAQPSELKFPLRPIGMMQSPRF